MEDGALLPSSVYQGLGWGPGGNLAAPPPAGAPDFGGLPPAVVQGMGWAPPPGPPPDAGAPAPPPELPQAPAALPSSSGPRGPAVGPPPGTPAAPDFRVPASAFGGGKPPAAPTPPAGSPPGRPAAPARPQTFDQRMTGLEQREDAATAAGQQAIDAGVAADKAHNAAAAEVYQKYDQQIQANADARKAENEQWAKIYATNEAKLDADRKQIESWKFNRNKFMDDLGVGGQVSWGIGAILAGIGNALQGIKGENPVIQMLQQNIHDANEQQMKDRDNLVQKLGMDRQTGLDAQAYHATRQAEIDKQDGLALTALSKQLEESALKTADQASQARGLQASAELKTKANALLQSNIQLRSQHQMQAEQNAIAGGHLALAQKQFDWTKQKDQQELDLKAAALLAKKDGKLSEEESKRAIFIPGPNGKPIPATRQDGSIVLAADPGDAAKIRRQVASTTTYNALIGKMARGIESHGGESDWWHSKEWQDMKTDYKSAVAELHEAYGVQSFREPTIEFFDQMTSAGLDPTAFNVVRSNATEALKNSNRNIQLKMNGLLQGQGYDRDPIAWEDTTSPQAPTQTDQDRAMADALKSPYFDTKSPGRLTAEFGNVDSDIRGAAQRYEQLQKAGGILPSVRQNLETWGAAAASADPAIAGRFRAMLENVAQESENPQTAKLAQQLLDRALSQQISNTPGAATAPEVIRGASGAPVPRER
jgi:hypothetical protein